MTKLVSAAIAVACLALGGCATIHTTPYLERTARASDALPGLTYSLPMLQYRVTVVRTLMECPGYDEDGKPTALKFAVDPAADGTYVPGEAYSVDARPLTGFLKTSSFEVNYYPSGTLKSIGVQAEDKTGEVVANTAKVVGAGLLMASGAPAVATAAAAASGAALATLENNKLSNFSAVGVQTTTEPRQLLCTEAAAKMVRALVADGKTLKGQAEVLRQANRDLKNLTDTIALRIRKPTDLIAPNCITSKAGKVTVKAEYTCLIDKQTQANEAIRQAEEDKAELIKKLSVTQTYTWPTQFADARRASLLPLSDENRATLAKLVEPGHPVRITGFSFDPGVFGAQQFMERANPGRRNPRGPAPQQHRPLSALNGAFGDVLKGAETGAEFSERLENLKETPPAVPAKCKAEDDNNIADADLVTNCLDYHLTLQVAPLADWPTAPDCGLSETGECVTVHDGVRDPLLPECIESPPDAELPAACQDKRVIHARDAQMEKGLFVREPASGRLIVCRQYEAAEHGNACPESADIAKLKSANFPQLGQLRFLPFNVAMFQAKDMGIFLGEDGRLQRYYMKSTKAAGEALTASMASAATEIGGALEKREEERKSDLEYAQNKDGKALQAQITELENAQKLKKMTSPAPADPLAPVRDETSVNEVYIAQLESQLTRQQLQAALESGDDTAARALLAIMQSKPK